MFAHLRNVIAATFLVALEDGAQLALADDVIEALDALAASALLDGVDDQVGTSAASACCETSRRLINSIRRSVYRQFTLLVC